ncbi:MAG: DNA/RNA helicase domain-containing protein, partial [Floccifex sp.]
PICWDWIKEGKNNSQIHDIQIGDFGMSWNLGSSNTWAIDAESVHEIGCIHTCQGLEFDYVGVIIGDDLRYEDGIVTDFTKRAKTDQSIKGLKSLYKKNKEEALQMANRIIKNTYRTLLTRGQKGCYIYCTDAKLSEYLKNRLK